MSKSNVEFFKGKDGQYYFNIVGNNGEVMSTSEGYTRMWSAKRAAKALAKVLLSSEEWQKIWDAGYAAGFEAGKAAEKHSKLAAADPYDDIV